ncbi:MAG: ROK family protein [Mariprofundaceae bacterium]
MSLILAADIGGTNIRAAIINANGDILEETRHHAQLSTSNSSENEVLEILASSFENLIKKHQPKAIGLGFPGFFLGDSGVLASSPNLPNLNNFNLARKLSARINLPVSAQNDALCAAIGEQRFGAGKGKANLLHITLGTGVGGGLILNHIPYTGEGGMAMEFGHLCINPEASARPCGCGSTGCLEAYASATAIISRYHEQTGLNVDTENIYAQACLGNEIAQSIIEDAGNSLGMAIAEAIKLLDIRTVTISGGLTGAWSLLYPPLTVALNDHLIPPLKGKVNVLRSTLEDNAGILGAAALASQN